VTTLAALPAVGGMFTHPFMRHAFLAGTVIALMSGLVGYFVVLRGQVFTGDALSHVAFAGALAALAFGLDARVGLFAATVAVGVGMGLLDRHGRADDVTIGTVFAWILGLGVFFLSVYTSSRSTANGTAGVNVLFGSVFGLSAQQAAVAALVGAAICLVVVAIARPLLFASLDEAVASARGVPVRALGVGFVGLVGVCTAQATQAVGALLLLGLLAAPAGAAQRLTDRPYRALWLSAGLAVVAMWAGLALSYAVPTLPPSFAVVAVASGTYLTAFAATATRQATRPPELGGA
jgi:zinc/manganese transport system permease protein